MCDETFTFTGIDSFTWLHGCEYLKAAELIKEHGGASAPYITNIAFAIEVFIKCLHVKKRFKPSTESPHLLDVDADWVRAKGRNSHSVAAVFDKLPEQIKWLASSVYAEKYQRILIQDLEEVGTAFADYRYQYENMGMMTISLDVLNDVAVFFKTLGEQGLRLQSGN